MSVCLSVCVCGELNIIHGLSYGENACDVSYLYLFGRNFVLMFFIFLVCVQLCV